MADVEPSKPQSLARDYLLEEKAQQAQVAVKPEESEAKPDVEAAEDIVPNTEEAPGVDDSEVAPASDEKAVEVSDSDAGESKDSTPEEATDNAIDVASSEESNDSTASEDTVAEVADETPQIKLETAPADYRFPTTNQTRHCFTRYIEYHRCIAAKGEGASECDKFAKYYRSLCPSEWVERWNEQRENGTFPGPL